MPTDYAPVYHQCRPVCGIMCRATAGLSKQSTIIITTIVIMTVHQATMKPLPMDPLVTLVQRLSCLRFQSMSNSMHPPYRVYSMSFSNRHLRPQYNIISPMRMIWSTNPSMNNPVKLIMYNKVLIYYYIVLLCYCIVTC